MPFRGWGLDPNTLSILQKVFDRFCADFFVVNEEERNMTARQMVRVAMDGELEPDRLMAAAVAEIRRIRSAEPKADGDGLARKKRS